MNLVGPVTDLFALLEFIDNARVAGRRHECWEPVETRYDGVVDLAGWYPARPPDDHRSAEAALHNRSLRTGKRRLTAIRPSEVLRPVVGRKSDDGIVLEIIVAQVLHDRSDNVVELCHPGLRDGPAVLWRAHLLVFFRQVRHDMHARWIEPEKEGLVILSRLVEELKGVC